MHLRTKRKLKHATGITDIESSPLSIIYETEFNRDYTTLCYKVEKV
jgi:hypothetical protein